MKKRLPSGEGIHPTKGKYLYGFTTVLAFEYGDYTRKNTYS